MSSLVHKSLFQICEPFVSGLIEYNCTFEVLDIPRNNLGKDFESRFEVVKRRKDNEWINYIFRRWEFEGRISAWGQGLMNCEA